MRKSLLIVLIGLVSCETPSECNDYYFSDVYKSFLFFNEGSLWIYEDTLLGITDSIYLVSQSVYFDDYCSISSQPQEELKQHFTSSYFVGDNNYSWSASGQAQLNEYFGGEIFGFYNNSGALIDSMQINGIWYKDILEFYFNNNFKYYWAKGIGLIKKDFYFNNSEDTVYNFELKSYYLN